MKYPFAIVEWRDHSTLENNDWKDLVIIKALTPVTIVSAGWILNETKEFMTICAHVGIDENGNLNDTSQGEMCIIKTSILRQLRIRKFDR